LTMKNIKLRTCVGCRKIKEKTSLLRIAKPETHLIIDEDQKLPGRGVYLCKEKLTCFEEALKRKAIERSLKKEISEEDKELIRNFYQGRKNGN